MKRRNLILWAVGSLASIFSGVGSIERLKKHLQPEKSLNCSEKTIYARKKLGAYSEPGIGTIDICQWQETKIKDLKVDLFSQKA